MAPIRILIGMFGTDQHEVGALAVSSALRDAGMDVIYVGRYQTPERLVVAAQDEGVDVIGISCHSWEYTKYTPKLIRQLRAADMAIPVVLGGSVITRSDSDSMSNAGVAAIYGPSSDVQAMVAGIEKLVRDQQENP